jgi:hypothetical protein
MVFHDKTL